MRAAPLVLAVDDSAGNRALLRKLISKLGYEFAEAYDGPSGIAAAEQLSPDLVLLDVRMPGMDGIDVCRRLRVRPDLAAVPILILTVLDRPQDAAAALEAGANDFLSKPFAEVELTARVRSLLRTKALQDRLVDVLGELKATNAELALLNDAKSRSLATLDEEMRIAHDIQVALLPKQMPQMPGWFAAALYRPARKVGGDFYDVLELPDGRFGLVMGDVTDKGMPAALVMATTQSIVRATARQFSTPSEVLACVNDVLCRDIPPKMFVTCLYAVLDPTSGALQFANAGHPLPYKVVEGRSEQLRARGFPLGLFPGVDYEQSDATIEPGAGLLLYTDGLIEAHDGTSQMFGTERVGRTVAGESIECSALLERLLAELRSFTGPRWEQEDDITLLTLRRQAELVIENVAVIGG